MKTMTCSELGGPCDHVHEAETADDIIKVHDRHLRDAVRGGDDAHKPAHEDMKGRWRRPISGLKWYRQTKRDFAALPEG